MKTFFAVRINEEYRLVSDTKRSVEKSCDEFYPADCYQDLYQIYQKKSDDLHVITESIFERCKKENYYVAEYDTRKKERKKALDTFLGKSIDIQQFHDDKLCFYQVLNQNMTFNVIHEREIEEVVYHMAKEELIKKNTFLFSKEEWLRIGLSEKGAEKLIRWQKGGNNLMFALKPSQKNKLIESFVAEKGILETLSLQSDGYYAKEGEFYIFPTKESQKMLMKWQLR